MIDEGCRHSRGIDCTKRIQWAGRTRKRQPDANRVCTNHKCKCFTSIVEHRFNLASHGEVLLARPSRAKRKYKLTSVHAKAIEEISTDTYMLLMLLRLLLLRSFCLLLLELRASVAFVNFSGLHVFATSCRLSSFSLVHRRFDLVIIAWQELAHVHAHLGRVFFMILTRRCILHGRRVGGAHANARYATPRSSRCDDDVGQNTPPHMQQQYAYTICIVYDIVRMRCVAVRR